MKRYDLKNRIRRAAAAVLSAVLALCASAPAHAAGSAFSDVPAAHPSYLYVQACAREGIMNGLGDGLFGPDEPLSAEQLCVMAVRACFKDEAVKEDGGSWSRPYTEAAERLGLLSGVGQGRKGGSAVPGSVGYDLSLPLRRCDAALIAARAAVLLRDERPRVARFDEIPSAGYSLSRCGQQIGYCLSAGLLGLLPDGAFHGDDMLTRAQGAELIAKLAGLGLSRADMSSYEAPEKENTRLLVLMYHRVLPDGSVCGDYDATESSLREDLAWLSENGFKTVLPSDLASGRPLPERAVMLTFDDGYEDNYRQAFPLLREYGAKAAVALIVSRIDEGEEGFMSWDMVREMCSSGLVEPGSHTYRLHGEGDVGSRGISRGSDSREQYEERLKNDLEFSAVRIEQETGVRPCYFAYPFGLTDSWANGIIDSIFPVSSVTRVGVPDVSRGTERLTRYNANSEYGAAHYAVRRYL